MDRQDVSRVQIIRGDARSLPLADDSVDLVVTSPPYLNLRAYQDGGTTYEGQIGSEESREAFIDALLEVTAECMRVTKPSGSIFVNLGDSYRDKGLQLTPHRYAIRCVDDLGLILRAEVIWSKPNGLPESVTDRVRRSHEDWFHFTLNPRYYSAVDEIREPSGPEKACGPGAMRGPRSIRERGTADPTMNNPLGKLPGSVWTVATEPLHVPDHLGIDHFAAFPTEWPRRIIQGWSPRGICVECGEGRRPVTLTDLGTKERETPAYTLHGVNGSGRHGQGSSTLGSRGSSATITGEACACVIHDERHCVLCLSGEHKRELPPTRPGVVLDPFGGTGTTALVAHALGRHGISNDMSADYCRLAGWRTTDPKQLAKAARREYVAPREQAEGQLDLLEGIA